jgi:hypothetical protein
MVEYGFFIPKYYLFNERKWFHREVLELLPTLSPKLADIQSVQLQLIRIIVT